VEYVFIDVLTKERRGLCTWEPVRDRLAGLWFRPNSKGSIRLSQLDLTTRRIVLPLSSSQWQTLKPETRCMLYTHAEKSASRLGSRLVALNRSLRLPVQAWQASGICQVGGDFFIPALALVLLENEFTLNRREKLWLVGDFPGLISLVTLIGRLGIPVTVQTSNPSRLEPIAYRLMYEEGAAVSLGNFNPDSWGSRDVVMVFDQAYLPFVPAAARGRGVLVVDLTDSSTFLAPRLETELQEQGVDGSLKVTAPLLEAWLWARGFGSTEMPAVGEPKPPEATPVTPTGNDSRPGTKNPLNAAREAAWKISRFKQKGHELGLWRFFLDKGFRALYNTTQGKGAAG